jgi:hypothetical protein
MAVTASGLALALAIGGTAAQTVGTIKAGNAARRAGQAEQNAAESQAQILEYNAAVEELRAQDAITRGAEDEQRFRSLVRGAIGAQRAGFAAGNIDVGFGSAVDVQADAAKLGELDALTIRTNAAREAWGYQVSAEDLRRGADVTRKEGRAAAEAGRVAQGSSRWRATGDVLGTTGSLLESRYGFGRG